MSTLISVSFTQPPINMREIMRYAGLPENDGRVSEIISECLREALPVLSCKAVYLPVTVAVRETVCDIGGIKIRSSALRKNLDGVKRGVLVCATVGIGIDRLINKYSRISEVRALIMQAIGAERVEAVLDALSDRLSGELGRLRPRFSVGYGDAPIEAQREITEMLDTARRIGVSLSDSFIMSPTKSVTAIIGIEE